MKEITNFDDTITCYYDMLRNNQKKIVHKLELHMPFYRFNFEKKIKSREIVFDTATNLLESAGLVLSKIYDDGKCYFVLTKVSYLPPKFKKPSVVLFKAECASNDMPSMYPVKLAGVIGDSNPSVFTVDLVEVVKVVVPKIQIDVTGDGYRIASGSGYKAKMLFESVKYKDLFTGRKFKHKNVAFVLSGKEEDAKSNNEIKGTVLRYCKELFPYDETRFEIARRVLTARAQNKHKFDKKAYLQAQKEAEEKKKEEEGL